MDVARRLRQHGSPSEGAKYLRGRQPLELVYQVAVGDRSTAARLEYKIKRLPPAEKQRIIDEPLDLPALLKRFELHEHARD